MTIAWILLGLRVVAALLLYVFLGRIFYQLWRASRRRLIPAGFLRRLDEPEHILPLSEVISLGRNPDNTFILTDDVISAHHATVTYQNGVWWIADLDSTNGTFLNEIPVHAPTPLDYGDIVSLGNIQFRLERGT